MWNLTELDTTKSYYLLLVQAKSGARSLVLQASDNLLYPPVGIYARTEVVPEDLLLTRDVGAISKMVRLTNGENFYVDAHNTWFTSAEMSSLSSDEDDEEIVPWLNGIPPLMAKK